MAEDPKQGGELNPIALAGGMPAAEGLAAGAGILSNISSTLQSIMKNPFFAQEGVQQISRRWDEHIIRRLKEMNNLTGASAAAFDKLARSGEGVRTMFSRIDGVVMGAGLRVAFLNEQLERQAATIGKYARLQDLSGGSYFNEAKRLQGQYYGNVATYGKAAAEQMKQVEMQLNTSMFAASGILDPGSRSNYAKAMGMYNQMYGGNAGGFVANLFSKYRSRGMNLGKAQDLLEQLRTRTEGKQIFNERGFQGVQEEFLQLSNALGSTGMGYEGAKNLSAAANLMQATRGMGAQERGNVYSMMTSSMLSGSQQASKLGMGMGMNPLAFSEMIQKQMLEDPEKAVLTVSRAIKNAIEKVPPGQREHWMQLMGIGNVEELKFWKEEVPGAVKHIDKLGTSIGELSNNGRKVGPDLQKVQEEAKDLFDVVGGIVGKNLNELTGGKSKYIGYGTSALSLAALLFAMKNRGGGLSALIKAKMFQDLVSSSTTKGGEEANAGGGTDFIKGTTDVVTSALLLKQLKGVGGAGGAGGAVKYFGGLSTIALALATTYLAAKTVYGAVDKMQTGGITTPNLNTKVGQQYAFAKAGQQMKRDIADNNYVGAIGTAYDASLTLWGSLMSPASWARRSAREERQEAARLSVKPLTYEEKMDSRRKLQGIYNNAGDLVQKYLKNPKTYDPIPTAGDLSETTGNTGLVTIQIVGPGGEDLGKKTVSKGQQVNFRLSQGQIQGVPEE